MKLIDFLAYGPLNDARLAMGAPLNTAYTGDRYWVDAELADLLRRAGVEVSPDDVEIVGELLEYRGQRVLLYIRDQYQRDNTPLTEYKYHIAHCSKLAEMWADGRSKRYVVATRTDGVFHVVDEYRPSGRFVEGERALNVCKLCLRRMRAKYPTKNSWDYESFDLRAFFDQFATEHTHMPVHSEKTGPENRYPHDWSEISSQKRKSVDWTCERCGRDCRADPSALHVHHKDRVKSNNHPSNLEALCVRCHRQEPGHW